MTKLRLFFLKFRKPFDYTQWQKEHYAGMSVSELNKKAVEYAKNNPINR